MTSLRIGLPPGPATLLGHIFDRIVDTTRTPTPVPDGTTTTLPGQTLSITAGQSPPPPAADTTTPPAEQGTGGELGAESP